MIPANSRRSLSTSRLAGSSARPKKQSVALVPITLGDGPIEAVESLGDRATVDRVVVFEIDLGWMPGRAVEAVDVRIWTRKLGVALFGVAGVVAREFANDLLPDVQTLRHVP